MPASIKGPSPTTWQRLKRLLVAQGRRYIGPEIGGTVAVLCAASVAQHSTHSLAIAAVAGSIGEIIGFYGVATTLEVRHYYRHHNAEARARRIWLTIYHSLRGLLVEFGLAEFLDSLFVRPFTLYYGSVLLHYNLLLGWFVGKLAADILFLVFASVGHALRRKLFTGDR